MPQDGDTHVGMTHSPQLGVYHFPDPAQPGHTAQVTLRLVDGLTAERHAAFRHAHQAELCTAVVALPELIGDHVQVIRDLREEDDIGAARTPAARVIQPACRPMSSMTSTRWWLSAVV